MSRSMRLTGRRAIEAASSAAAKSRSDAASVVASCVRADSSVEISTRNGSAPLSPATFSTAGSPMPPTAVRSRRRMRPMRDRSGPGGATLMAQGPG